MDDIFHEELSRLAQLVHSPVKSIEILPGSGSSWSQPSANPHFPYLLDDGNLGIPQKDLYTLYVASSRAFHKLLSLSISAPLLETQTQINCLTTVIVLANPAHTTALNKRRFLLIAGHIHPASELKFVTHLLQCAKEAAKSSVLWHHRRWVLRFLHSTTFLASHPTSHHNILRTRTDDDLIGFWIPLVDLRREMMLCTKAAELYPRNYVSWLHRYKCLSNAVGRLQLSNEQAIANMGDDSEANTFPDGTMLSYETLETILEFILEERRTILDYIRVHVSDYTSMNYFCHIERYLLSYGDRLAIPSVQSPLPSTITRDSLQYLKLGVYSSLSTSLPSLEELLLTYPEHEGLWYCLRHICAIRLSADRAQRGKHFVEEAKEIVLSISGGEEGDYRSKSAPVGNEVEVANLGFGKNLSGTRSQCFKERAYAMLCRLLDPNSINIEKIMSAIHIQD